MKYKLFTYGIVASLFATSFGIVTYTLIFSKGELFESLQFLYLQKKLGAIISLGALLNLPLFYISLRKEKYPFAAGVVVFSLVLVLIVALLKSF